MLTFDRLDPRERAVAEQILALLREAHTDEARWAPEPDNLPFEHTLERLMADAVVGTSSEPARHEAFRDAYHGAYDGSLLVGCIGIAPAAEATEAAGTPGLLCIGNLAVRGTHRRRGVARALMARLIDGAPGHALVVVTGLDNGPALALYTGLGFVPIRRGVLGPQAVPVVQLRRAPGPRLPVPAATFAPPARPIPPSST